MQKDLKTSNLHLGRDLKVKHGLVSTEKLYGISPALKVLFYAFESPFIPHQQLPIGHLPRVDLVTQLKSNGQTLKPIEIKLTALPDNSTCGFSYDKFVTKIVIRLDKPTND